MNTAAELVKLPVIEKIALIETLWASIPESEIPVELAHVVEARRRLDELKANPASGLSYDELRARLG